MKKNSGKKSKKIFSVAEKVILATMPSSSELPKSERYSDLIDDDGLKENLKEQLWNKLSAFIESQIKFVKVKRIVKVCKKKSSEKESPVDAKPPIMPQSPQKVIPWVDVPIPRIRQRGSSWIGLNPKNRIEKYRHRHFSR